MQLRRIEVRDFRKLNHVVVQGLQNGLNVIVGDNEAGKSTLLAALRAVLFERHRVGGEVAQSMLPYRQSVRPEIAVEFDLHGKPWRLRKAFCQKPDAELVGPAERHTGDEVEERLAALFGFTPPGKGASHPDKHQGAYGLLWVEQGAAHRALGIGAGRETIASALDSEVGQVLGGERGRVLLAAAEERRNLFWGKNDKPRSTLKALFDEVAELTAAKGELEAQFATYDAKILELGSKQEALARHAREDRLNKALQDLALARDAVSATAKLQQVLKEAGDRRKLCHTERESASQRREARQRLYAKLDAARDTLATAQADADEARGVLASREATARAREERLTRDGAALRRAEEQVAAVEQAIARREVGEQLVKLREQLAASEEAERKRREAAAAAAAISMTKEVLAELEALQKSVDRSNAQLQAASVRICFDPDEDRSITVDGLRHEGVYEFRLSHDAELVLEGFGRLKIHPGGGVAELAREADKAARALEERLRAHATTDIAQARSEWQRKLECQSDAEAQRKLVGAIAPKGVDVLRQAVEGQRALLARPVPETVAAVADATAATLDETRRGRDTATELVRAGENAAKQAGVARSTADRELATLEERAAGAQREHDTLVRELADARAHVTDESLADVFTVTEKALDAAQHAETEAQATFEQANPELASLKLQRAERAEQSIRSDIEKLTREMRDLQVELTALGRDGIGEKIAETEGQLALKQKQLAARELEAAAARLLHEVLTEAQRESKDRWLGPVRQRVKPYLKLLQPDSDIVLNEETLEIEGFVRSGVRESFEALSVGAREQVAVITRLALADILRASSRPSAVILDDALVNTDEGRLERMHLVLQKAAQDLQVLIFTCRERDFFQLGAPIVRIQ